MGVRIHEYFPGAVFLSQQYMKFSVTSSLLPGNGISARGFIIANLKRFVIGCNALDEAELNILLPIFPLCCDAVGNFFKILFISHHLIVILDDPDHLSAMHGTECFIIAVIERLIKGFQTWLLISFCKISV